MPTITKDKKFNSALLYDRRMRMGLSLKALGKILGLSNAAIAQWEEGKHNPNPSSLLKLSKALRMKPEQFF